MIKWFSSWEAPSFIANDFLISPPTKSDRKRNYTLFVEKVGRASYWTENDARGMDCPQSWHWIPKILEWFRRSILQPQAEKIRTETHLHGMLMAVQELYCKCSVLLKQNLIFELPVDVFQKLLLTVQQTI